MKYFGGRGSNLNEKKVEVKAVIFKYGKNSI